MVQYHFSNNFNILKTTFFPKTFKIIILKPEGPPPFVPAAPTRRDRTFPRHTVPRCCMLGRFLVSVGLCGFGCPSPGFWSHRGWVRGYSKNMQWEEGWGHTLDMIWCPEYAGLKKKIMFWLFVFVVPLSFTVRWLTTMKAFTQNLCSNLFLPRKRRIYRPEGSHGASGIFIALNYVLPRAYHWLNLSEQNRLYESALPCNKNLSNLRDLQPHRSILLSSCIRL